MSKQFMLFIYVLLSLVIFIKPSLSASDISIELQNYLSEKDLGANIRAAAIAHFYQERNYEPVWFDEKNNALIDLEKFNKAIQDSSYENGLSDPAYNLALINKNTDSSLQREVLLTNAVMNYMHDLSSGRIDPQEYDSMIFMEPENKYLDIHMRNILRDWSPENYLKKVEPQQPEYQTLKQKLAEYRALAQKGGWNKIPITDVIIYPGQSHPVIPEIRARLKDQSYNGNLSGEIWIDPGKIDDETLQKSINSATEITTQTPSEIDPKYIYDIGLVKKIAEFQYMHGKKTDGILGPETLSALNIPVEDRIKQLMLTMERWRWFPDNMGQKYILVNIAGFYTRAVEDNKIAFTMPIIVGEVAHQTPVFSSVISNIKMHPDWISPDSIARRYLIDKIQADPALINQLGYQIQYVDAGQVRTIPWSRVNIAALDNLDLSKYRFRQKPGNYNALGLARFSIENNYSIFMHGTPSKNLFNADTRTFSSGCIRVQDPLKLAKFLLKDAPGYNERSIEDLYYLDENEHPDTSFIKLEPPVPVYLTYATVWTDQSGSVHFSDDVYGRDKKLAKIFQPVI